jgi:hypothetical protein
MGRLIWIRPDLIIRGIFFRFGATRAKATRAVNLPYFTMLLLHFLILKQKAMKVKIGIFENKNRI